MLDGVQSPSVLSMEFKTYLNVDDNEIEPTKALEKINEIEGVEIETAF